jgi:hydroxymethylglutaryl-CoA reductase (NADPH)
MQIDPNQSQVQSQISSIAENLYCAIPLQWVGPIPLLFKGEQIDIKVPLATYESPLWPSVKRGAIAARETKIAVTLIQDFMTRSCVVEAPNAAFLHSIRLQLDEQHSTIQQVVESSTRFGKFKQVHFHQIGNLLYIRLEMFAADASGHNMLTKAQEALLDWLLSKFPNLRYVSISGNFCCDKKNSAVNPILGRGKYVIAETAISRRTCSKVLKTTPEAIVDINIKKNLLGSIAAGGIHTANAHFANMLLAFYLATGQDAANIVEGSQGVTQATLVDDQLYFSVTLPNVIVGTCGNGKDLPWIKKTLEQLKCLPDKNHPGASSNRLAALIAATVLCGELSLLAAQTNRGELVRSHMELERKVKS